MTGEHQNTREAPTTDERSLPKLLREAERRVNAHVWGDRRSVVSIPADRDRDVDLLLMEAAATIEALSNHVFNGQDIVRTMFSQPENETARAWAKEWAHTEVNRG